MIIVRLIGGLGNQLFQYAAARQLSEIHQTELKIDISQFEEYKLHKYSLQHFNIIEDFISKEEICGIKEIKARYFHFDLEFKKISDNIILKGYWQSEKYFVDIVEIIRQELTVKSPLSGNDKKIAEQIMYCDSVSVHIRRTDYLPSTYKEQLFEACSLDYYKYSVDRIASAVKRPHFFVFTDDKVWVRENFQLPYPITFVDHNGPDKNYEDMRLMSLCKHNIIANSSFSWWGAWLNKNSKKMIFAPKKWFTEIARSSSKDVIPDSWIKA